MTDPSNTPRQQLLGAYQAALDAVAGDRVVRECLDRHPPESDVSLVAVGKAAERMAAGALAALGERLRAGLVITKHDHLGTACEDPRIECLSAGHPVPDRASLTAGERMLGFIGEVPRRDELLVLVSGGASSLVEVLPEGTELEELARVTDWLLGSGQGIDAVNRVRKGLSRIKAGRLARYLAVRRTRNLMLSDVPGDDPRVIGSGLLVPHPRESVAIDFDLPDWISTLLGRVPAAPEPADPCFARVETRILAGNREARRAAAAELRRLGWEAKVHDQVFTEEAEPLGRRLARTLREGRPGVYIWGGESTVRLPENPGRGGRSQTLALAAALELAGRDDVYLLAAGTDGTDGPTDAAGALVDGGTLTRGAEGGLDAAEHLRRADAGPFLEASGDLIDTGPTGTNVMDLVIGLKTGPV